MNHTITLTTEQRDAVLEMLDKAREQSEYDLKQGNISADYDDEWPEVAKDRANGLHLVAEAIRQLWEKPGSYWERHFHVLANEYEASAKERADATT